VIIDAHFHLWDPATRSHAWLAGLPTLRRPFQLADYTAAAAPSDVAAGVLVQVLADPLETEEFLALAARHPGAGEPQIAGVVGWVDLTRPDIADEVARLRERPGGGRLVGLRHLVQDEPDPGWLDRPEVRRGVTAVGAAGLAFDLLVRPAQLPSALRLARKLSEVRFVVDHGAKPEIAASRTEPWRGLIGELAALPNVSCKLSGLVTEAGPSAKTADILPYTDRLLECFGPERLMFGSDWPVCLLAADYPDVVALARAAVNGQLNLGEREAVFYGNAITAYGLHVSSSNPVDGSIDYR
jgi:L-fuconolactonase